MADRSREHGFVLVLMLLAPLGLLALGFLLQPDPRGFGTHEQLGFRPCLPVRLWNVPCPGCGVTTAVVLATRGRLVESVRTQPFGLVTLAVACAGALWALRGQLVGEDLWQELQARNWRRPGLLLLAALLAAWAYKVALVRGWLG